MPGRAGGKLGAGPGLFLGDGLYGNDGAIGTVVASLANENRLLYARGGAEDRESNDTTQTLLLRAPLAALT